MDFLTRNLWWKLFALLIAVLLWIGVANEPELSTFVSVPVEYKDLPDNLELSSNVVERVELELRGPSGELRNFSSSKTAVVLNMADVNAGQRTFSIGDGHVQLPRGIRLIRAIPSELRFEFERRITRTIPVEVRFREDPHSRYAVASYEVNPPTLTIEGPENRVRRVQAAVTDLVDLGAAAETAEYHVNTFIQDPQVRFVSPSGVTVRVTLRKAARP